MALINELLTAKPGQTLNQFAQTNKTNYAVVNIEC